MRSKTEKCLKMCLFDGLIYAYYYNSHSRLFHLDLLRKRQHPYHCARSIYYCKLRNQEILYKFIFNKSCSQESSQYHNNYKTFWHLAICRLARENAASTIVTTSIVSSCVHMHSTSSRRTAFVRPKKVIVCLLISKYGLSDFNISLIDWKCSTV